jgi:hypothetical protein
MQNRQDRISCLGFCVGDYSLESWHG